MPSNPKDPFTSARLTYRAILTPQDNALFQAINDDRQGYMNSNISNNRLASTSDAQQFQKETAEDSLLGAVICITPKSGKVAEAEGVGRDDGVKGFVEPRPKTREMYGTPIGEIHLKALSQKMAHHRWTEIGLDILPEFQGRGYGSEAIEWALDYSFRRAGVHRVMIRAFEWNEGAIRLYGKLGFKEEGRLREELWHEGRWWDGFIFGMLEGEWWEIQRQKKKKEHV